MPTSSPLTDLPVGVILAGGLSRRMFASEIKGGGGAPVGDTNTVSPAGDKALLSLGTTTMLG